MMDREQRYGAYMGIIIGLAIGLALLLLGGCATYDIERCEAGVCSRAKITSPRKFKSIAFKYNGESRTFELTAGDVGTDVSALNTLASVILMQAQAQQQTE